MKYTGFTRPTRIEQINSYLKQKGYIEWELVQSSEYFYFNHKRKGNSFPEISSTTVPVNRVSGQTLNDWLEDLKYIIEMIGV